ncbi:hypothetical protein TVAG_100630 [Trichomonas vaginalis G3]|uniref:Uncharacterized protein n=1 Tax=Trichomonas vaginalis (strain ATCC PRA-98 / G3) TaxID=412133 RepID=A2ENP0_TRIV3|nr:endocytic recycling [Trichomonas vaginalis G3]EAY05740.1 hypothetical protein TVAG_100630 [Trichomonas vaginalis G3]KAI5535152.1 endocytic recycling [Trichomonas vaginalis G3]|eukprot:XP_001317963.1 hypothetical protein [Trichomonas vaginalis G3]
MASKSPDKEGEIKIPYDHFSNDQLDLIKQYVPEKFFAKDVEDPIAETIALIPSIDDPNFDQLLTDRIQGESEALDMISRSLNKDLLANYNTYLKSMQMISELNRQLNLTTSNVRQTRQVMLAAETEISETPRVFFRQIVKKKNLASVIELVAAVNQIFKSTDELNQAIANKDFVKALDLCLKPADLKSEIRALSGVEDLISSLQNMYARVLEEMDKTLVSMATTFDRNIYANLMHSYQIINKINTVPQKLQEAFLNNYKDAHDKIMLGADVSRAKAFRAVYEKFIDASANVSRIHQQIVLWHRGSSDYEPIRKSIESMAKTLWDNSECQVTQLLLKAPIDKLNFENFDALIKSTTSFIQFGATVVDLPGGQLSGAMDTITTKYFKLFHKNAMEAVREVLETDSWDRCPSDSSFERSILTLSIPIKENSDAFGDKPSTGMTSINVSPAYEFDHSKTTNSCSNVLKFIHQYLSLMKAVPKLAAETFKGIQQLVEYYSLAALHLFHKNAPLKPLEMTNLGKINFNGSFSILLTPDGMDCLSRVIHHLQDIQLVYPTESQVAPELLRTLDQASAASDNMKGVAWYLRSVRSFIEESLPENSLGALRRFFSDVVSIFLQSFASFCFPFFGPSMVNLTEFDTQVKNTKWTINEPPLDPHPFTKLWTENVSSFVKQVDEMKLAQDHKDEILTSLWNYSSFSFINDLATIQKVTAEGRTAMLSDFRNMAHDYVNVTKKRIQPDNSWVAGFVQAYFLGIEDFKKWAVENAKRYTQNHMMSIVETGFSDNIKRQDRKDLSNFVKSLY